MQGYLLDNAWSPRVPLLTGNLDCAAPLCLTRNAKRRLKRKKEKKKKAPGPKCSKTHQKYNYNPSLVVYLNTNALPRCFWRLSLFISTQSKHLEGKRYFEAQLLPSSAMLGLSVLGATISLLWVVNYWQVLYYWARELTQVSRMHLLPTALRVLCSPRQMQTWPRSCLVTWISKMRNDEQAHDKGTRVTGESAFPVAQVVQNLPCVSVYPILSGWNEME